MPKIHLRNLKQNSDSLKIISNNINTNINNNKSINNNNNINNINSINNDSSIINNINKKTIWTSILNNQSHKLQSWGTCVSQDNEILQITEVIFPKERKYHSWLKNYDFTQKICRQTKETYFHQSRNHLLFHKRTRLFQ